MLWLCLSWFVVIVVCCLSVEFEVRWRCLLVVVCSCGRLVLLLFSVIVRGCVLSLLIYVAVCCLCVLVLVVLVFLVGVVVRWCCRLSWRVVLFLVVIA